MLRLFSVLLAATGLFAEQSIFRFPEPEVQPSPAEKAQILIPEGEKVIDFDVWSMKPEAMVLSRTASGAYKVTAWNIGKGPAQLAFDLPAGFEAHAIVCHPESRTVFLTGRRAGNHEIVSWQFNAGKWREKTLFTSPAEVRRLLVSPRPFSYYNGKTGVFARRLLFAVKDSSGAYAIRSIMEDGGRGYQVLGPEATYIRMPGNASDQPNENFVPSALPSAFHPAGHILLWEDARHCFHSLKYERDNWGKTSDLPVANLCGGSLTVTPNGMGMVHWKPSEPGVTIFLNRGRMKIQQAKDYTFLSTPSSTPDGRGIVGLVQTPEGLALAYVPVSVPLANVVNAWMFTETPDDAQRLAKDSGLFRLQQRDQIYELYDSESYLCGGYDSATPTRPYLVTTDLFWEIFAAAYEGMFIVQERRQSMPAFWAFVGMANASAASFPAGSPWPRVFKTAAALRNPPARSGPEIQRILKASGKATSSVIGKPLDYSEMKPRGHYESDRQMAAYFRAFRYLTAVSAAIDSAPLRSLPAPVREKALAWVRSYERFIAPPNAPLVWGSYAKPPLYALHPETSQSFFPLSWGFDNEILLSTVYHGNWPESQQIKGPGGERAMASGLDVVAALGNSFARDLLAEEIRKYPPLGAALDQLKARYVPDPSNLYNAWISALAVQWANDVSTHGGINARAIWQTKRLQTGLASWATLRHATVLVNQKAVAECGEGGFEELVVRPPRGYVEPDAATLAAIAGLFDKLADVAAAGPGGPAGKGPGAPGANDALRQALLKRLRETAAEVRRFQRMAYKEMRGEALSDAEYDAILHIGGVAEHNFLVYKTLASENLAIANPEPMAKIADAAQGPAGHLEVAVGQPMEWDQVVPYFGRREIVRGSVYSYYEFVSPNPMTDSEWRKELDSRALPAWVQRFVSPGALSCPAVNPF